jgi:PAS domain-containing protein
MVSAAPLVGNLQRHHPDLNGGQGMDLPVSMEELQRMQQFVTHQQSMGAHGMMVTNGNLQAMLENQGMMLSMGMGGVENGISLDPQLCSGDQFGAMVATAPMPGMPSDYSSMGSTGSILTEFTKRRNWSQRILEELQDFLHILTPQGKIVYASESCKALTGFAVDDLIGKFITEYLHEDDSGL